jgi:N-acylneuraminate cytidylyltransferase
LPARPAAVVFDFDGVFTDNRVLVDETGREAVVCSRGDGMGLGALKQSGVTLLVLSTEVNPVVAARCRKLGLECVHGLDDKRAALQDWARLRAIDLADVVYVGNDVNDRGCLQAVGFPVVVADAHPDVLPEAKLVLTSPGGQGAVREVADLILENQKEQAP